MSDRLRTQRTFYFEMWRSGTAGIIETAGTTFLLLIAVRWFEAGSLSKALVAGAGSFGLLASPMVVSWVTGTGWTTSRAASRILALGALSFALMAAFPVLWLFVVCSIIGMATSSAIIPLLTQIYQENYPQARRGKMFSRTVMIRIAVAALFGKLAGDALSGHFEHFPFLLLVFAGAFGLASFSLARCPSRPIKSDGGAHPLRALRFVREDVLFRRVLISWMIMGFANLMMLPLRVEYLANSAYGWELTAGRIALLVIVVPNLARLLLSPLWGYLFDRMNFFVLRCLLNLGFALGIVSFFIGDTWAGMAVGAVIFGASNAGGEVAWSLWVTKFSPPDRVADYMSVHTFLTGIRGVLAPVTAFYLTGTVGISLSWLAGLATILIVLATLLLALEIKSVRKSREGNVLVEEVSE